MFLAAICGCWVLGAMGAFGGFVICCWQAPEWVLFAGLVTVEFNLVAMFFWKLANKIWPNRFFAG